MSYDAIFGTKCFDYYFFCIVVILTGAGVSAESGVPTFRGAGGFWREFQAQQLATPEAFEDDPSLVWEFYHYRREVMLDEILLKFVAL